MTPTESRADVDALAAEWPQLPDLDGVDLFEECGVSGEPNSIDVIQPRQDDAPTH